MEIEVAQSTKSGEQMFTCKSGHLWRNGAGRFSNPRKHLTKTAFTYVKIRNEAGECIFYADVARSKKTLFYVYFGTLPANVLHFSQAYVEVEAADVFSALRKAMHLRGIKI